jgi:hypothetical protein
MRVTSSSKYSVTPLKCNLVRTGRIERFGGSADVGFPSQCEIEGIGIQVESILILTGQHGEGGDHRLR